MRVKDYIKLVEDKPGFTEWRSWIYENKDLDLQDALNQACSEGLEWLCNVLNLQSAWAAYMRIQQLARAEYMRIQQPAWAEYERTKQSAWAEYPWADYERTKQSAWAELMPKIISAILTQHAYQLKKEP